MKSTGCETAGQYVLHKVLPLAKIADILPYMELSLIMTRMVMMMMTTTMMTMRMEVISLAKLFSHCYSG